MSDVWNNVTIYGPQIEIERFRSQCLNPMETVIRDGQSGWDGCWCSIDVPTSASTSAEPEPVRRHGQEVLNFQQFSQDSPVEFSFSFDTDGEFPTHLFEDLADHFPLLAFDCHCIEEGDAFLGYGWYNAPPGGEEFSQGFSVPPDYWTTGCAKRSPEAESDHHARIDRLVRKLVAELR